MRIAVILLIAAVSLGATNAKRPFTRDTTTFGTYSDKYLKRHHLPPYLEVPRCNSRPCIKPKQ